MIWLASFPRSGNTYFRNILFEVFGIESGAYRVTNRVVDPAEYKNTKSIYLVRDGRDALVYIAHHRKDIVASGSNSYKNLAEAVIAREGSFFGGWRGNVQECMNKGEMVNKNEDLVQNPLKEFEKLHKIMDIPDPKIDKLPTFKPLKNGMPKYGSGKKNLDKSIKIVQSKKFYQRGVVGFYKDELPYIFRIIFFGLKIASK